MTFVGEKCGERSQNKTIQNNPHPILSREYEEHQLLGFRTRSLHLVRAVPTPSLQSQPCSVKLKQLTNQSINQSIMCLMNRMRQDLDSLMQLDAVPAAVVREILAAYIGAIMRIREGIEQMGSLVREHNNGLHNMEGLVEKLLAENERLTKANKQLKMQCAFTHLVLLAIACISCFGLLFL
ncbi:hypothetical protein Sjap_007830 [Stephania japonica]|uniref:Uncharacterized protein n=1 Tax=Stephania japonica TaxID=461633 RepID=A0AAP0JP94_9MAGN